MDTLEEHMILNRCSCLAELIDKYEDIKTKKKKNRGATSYSGNKSNKRSRKDENSDDAVMINLDA